MVVVVESAFEVGFAKTVFPDLEENHTIVYRVAVVPTVVVGHQKL